MTTHRFSFQVRGAAFHAGATGLSFAESFEPGSIATFGGSRGTVVPFGAALYVVPELPRGDKESDFHSVFTHLHSLLPIFRNAGATEFILHLRREFASQCNEEFTREELRLLASLDCHLFYQARNLNERET
jgi:hypothetical protein